MNRFFVVVITIFSGLITLCALSTALTSAASSMASSAASAAASTALLISQCANVLMIFVAIAAGMGIGAGFVALRGYPQKRSISQPPYTHGLPSTTRNSLLLPPIDDEDDDALTQALISIIQERR